MSRHVVIIVENLPLPFDRRVWLEARTLVAAGYSVSVICPTGKGFNSLDETIEGVRILRHPLTEATGALGYAWEYLSALGHEARLLRLLRRQGRIDVIQLCNPPDVLFLTTLWYKLAHRTKVVFDHHDINPELFEVKFGRRGLPHALLGLAERMTFAVADVVVSTNDSYREIAIARGHVPADRVYVVKSAPDCDEYMPISRQSKDSLVVGYVGIMGEQDGVDVLLRAAALVLSQEKGEKISFRLIGGGSELERLQRLASDLGIDDAVEFTGFLYGPQMREALGECDVGVVPDPKNDYNDKCTMNKVLEYMALGLPVVQFDLLESRRSAGDAAHYAEGHDAAALADAILRVCSDSGLRSRMRDEGLKRIRAQEWKTQAESLLAAYDHALAGTAHE